MKRIHEFLFNTSEKVPDQPDAAETDAAQREEILSKARAQGYSEATADLMRGLKGANSFALVSIEPAVSHILKKAKDLEQAGAACDDSTDVKSLPPPAKR